MSRARGTATIPGAQDSGSPTRSGELPPTVLLNRHRVRALGMPAGTLTVDAAQGRRAASAASTESRNNQRDGMDRNGANPYGLNAVRPAVPKVSLGRSPSFFPKQEWAGRVTAILKDEFDARLRDLTHGGRAVATIDLEEIDPEDRARMRIGSLFHWVMGYERSVSGTRSYVSRFIFLNPPRLTARDLKSGREWATRLRAKWNLD